MNAILDYIEERSPRGAENVKGRLQAAIDLLANHPQRTGDERRRAAPHRRQSLRYVNFYQPTATEVVIHSVRHAARRLRRWREIIAEIVGDPVADVNSRTIYSAGGCLRGFEILGGFDETPTATFTLYSAPANRSKSRPLKTGAIFSSSAPLIFAGV